MAIAPVMNVNFKGNGYNTSFKGKEVDEDNFATPSPSQSAGFMKSVPVIVMMAMSPLNAVNVDAGEKMSTPVTTEMAEMAKAPEVSAIGNLFNNIEIAAAIEPNFKRIKPGKYVIEPHTTDANEDDVEQIYLSYVKPNGTAYRMRVRYLIDCGDEGRGDARRFIVVGNEIKKDGTEAATSVRNPSVTTHQKLSGMQTPGGVIKTFLNTAQNNTKIKCIQLRAGDGSDSQWLHDEDILGAPDSLLKELGYSSAKIKEYREADKKGRIESGRFF